MCVRWGIFDACVRRVAIFDYNQRAAADVKLAQLLARNKGLYFLQPVKEPMSEVAPNALAAEERQQAGDSEGPPAAAPHSVPILG
jgi:hypothetical protein